jgi:hypothetical protein
MSKEKEAVLKRANIAYKEEKEMGLHKAAKESKKMMKKAGKAILKDKKK